MHVPFDRTRRSNMRLSWILSDRLEIMESLDEVAALSDQKQKIEQYRAALQKVLQNESTEQCKEFVDHSALHIASLARILCADISVPCRCSITVRSVHACNL